MFYSVLSCKKLTNFLVNFLQDKTFYDVQEVLDGKKGK